MNAPLLLDTFATPFGPFSLALTESGALAATAFGPREALLPRLTNFHVLRESPSSPSLEPTNRHFHVIRENLPAAAFWREQILAYFAGQRRDFEGSLEPGGTPFQERVWAALRAIPFGETRSYGDLARQLGSGPRAVGRANATNPICLIVPCHRIIGADGSLTGFAFGESIKQRLLDHERLPSRRPRAA
jgi:methylated-DNA-[protein]-cysteine S-methyltransferase